MERTQVQRWAKSLRIMVGVLIVCNMIALFFVPAMVWLAPDGLFVEIEERVLHLMKIRPYGEDDIYIPIFMLALASWMEVFHDVVHLLYTVFFLTCGSCSLIILRQARCILDTILEGNPFQIANANSMRRAAVCCWVVSGAAFVRMIAELMRHHSTAPLYTYNTLFVPVFLMAGLLFLVMSALFRQAAELKEDQDLTI